MTTAELENALLYAGNSGVVAVYAMDDLDTDKIVGVVLNDRNFIRFHKPNVKSFNFEFAKDQLVMKYVRRTKDVATNTLYDEELIHVIPFSLIVKVLVTGAKVAYTAENTPLGVIL